MHEFSIAKQIANCLKKVTKKEQATRILSFEVELGEFVFANSEQLKFWLKELLKGEKEAKAKVYIKRVKPIIHCNKCGYEGSISFKEEPMYHFILPELKCKRCGHSGVDLIKGKEYNLKSVKIERKSKQTKQ